MAEEPADDGGFLPARTDAAEEAYVARWRDHGEGEGTLLEACRAAVDARRWKLAARLVSLVPERDGEDPDLTRARQAARLVVLDRLRPEDVSWSTLTKLWSKRNQARRMSRSRERWRKALGLKPGGRGRRGR